MSTRRSLRRSFVSSLLRHGLALGAATGVGASAFSVRAQGAASRTVFGAGERRVALLLPPPRGAFRRASAALLAGVRAAHARDGAGTVCEVVEVSERGDELPALYRELRSRGFVQAIGPLPRDGVGHLSDIDVLPVPTLALNLPDPDRPVPRNALFFSLAIETEGRQVARLAWDDAMPRATPRVPPRAAVLTSGTPLARRAASAFADAWRELGGEVAPAVETDAAEIAEFKAAFAPLFAEAARVDLLFAATGPDAMRVARPALPPELRVYGTSLMNAVAGVEGLRVPELDGVRFVDMPWQLLPDHPAVMAYARPGPDMRGHDLQRLYAFGIDAFRVAREQAGGAQRLDVDGVTGRLRLDAAVDPRVDRRSVAAEYRAGVPVPLEAR